MPLLVQIPFVIGIIAFLSVGAMSLAEDRRDAFMAEHMSDYLRDAIMSSFLADGDGLINTGSPPMEDADSDCRKEPGWTPPVTPRNQWAEVLKTANLFGEGVVSQTLDGIFQVASLDPANGLVTVSLAAGDPWEEVLLGRMAAHNGAIGTDNYDAAAHTLDLEFTLTRPHEAGRGQGLSGPGLRHLLSAVPFGGPVCSNHSQTGAIGYHYGESGSPTDYDKWDWRDHPWSP